MVKKPAKAAGKKIKNKDVLEQRVEHFAEEVEALGKRFGKKMEKRSEGWDWFNRTFGIVGPLISSIIGMMVFAVVVWILRLVNLAINNSLIYNIHSFLFTNIGWFFLIFIFFSYSSYFSREYASGYMLFSPIIVSIGITIGFWIAMHAINIVNFYVVNSVLSAIVVYIRANLLWIFGFFVFVGYVVLLAKIALGECCCKAPERIREERVVMKASKESGPEVHRLYRSGKDKILGGVCGGIAEYLGVDPVLIRLLWILGSFLWGFGVILYIIAWIIIPRNPKHKW
jgi:phage shock protein PspC (stress-responsive transcriptional regulator)